MAKEIIGFKFVRSENITVPNDFFLKEKYLKEGYTEKGETSKGEVRLVKKSKAIFFIENKATGKVEEIDLHDEICFFYDVQVLRIERVKKFAAELFTKKVMLKYNFEGQRYEIIKGQKRGNKK